MIGAVLSETKLSYSVYAPYVESLEPNVKGLGEFRTSLDVDGVRADTSISCGSSASIRINLSPNRSA